MFAFFFNKTQHQLHKEKMTDAETFIIQATIFLEENYLKKPIKEQRWWLPRNFKDMSGKLRGKKHNILASLLNNLKNLNKNDDAEKKILNIIDHLKNAKQELNDAVEDMNNKSYEATFIRPFSSGISETSVAELLKEAFVLLKVERFCCRNQ